MPVGVGMTAKGVNVAHGLGDGVGVPAGVMVAVAPAVLVGVRVAVAVNVGVAVSVAVAVGVGVGVSVAVAVGVGVGVSVAVAVGVGVGDGVCAAARYVARTPVHWVDASKVPAARYVPVAATMQYSGRRIVWFCCTRGNRVYVGVPLVAQLFVVPLCQA
jgi:hypothetical protein